MQMLVAYLMARRVRRARARRNAQLIMRLVTAEFSAMVLKTMEMKQYRRDIRIRHKFTREELPEPEMSSWAHVVRADTDNGYLEMTSLTVGAFKKLHDAFRPQMLSHWVLNRTNTGSYTGSACVAPGTFWAWLGVVLHAHHGHRRISWAEVRL